MNMFKNGSRQAVLGSFLCTLCGWVAGIAYGFLITTMGMLFRPNFDLMPNLLGIPYVILGTSVVVIPVWWFVLRPLYTRLPRTHALWTPWRCVGLGALVGGVLGRDIGAVTGAVACWCAVQTVDHFRKEDIR